MVNFLSFLQHRHKKVKSPSLSKLVISILSTLLVVLLLITTITRSKNEKSTDLLSEKNNSRNLAAVERNLKDTVDLEMVILSISIVLIVCFAVKALLGWLKIHWLPESCAYILVGGSISMINEFFMKDEKHDMVMEMFYFDEQFFLQILLPAILFDAALSIDKMSFRRDLFPILLFAFVGTTFSTITIGYMIYWITNGMLPLLESLVFGALISSIDPVATLGTLSGVGVSQTGTLYTLIFGESLLNDGVAIVLFETLKMHLGQGEAVLDDIKTYQKMAYDFGYVLIGSIVIAIFCGTAATIYYWLLQKQQVAVVEVAAFFCWALIPYYVAEFFDCSGVMSILVMGFIMDYYILGDSRNNMQQSSGEGEEDASYIITPSEVWNGKGLIENGACRVPIRMVSHTLATTMETLLFAYLGLFLFDGKAWNMKLDMVAVLSCIVSRAIMIIVLAALVNAAVKFDLERKVGSCFSRRKQKSDDNNRTTPQNNSLLLLDQRTQTILFLAGIRGAVSFALVRNIPGSTPHKNKLKAMTSTCIIVTLFVFGVLTYFFVQRDNESEGMETINKNHHHTEEERIPLQKKKSDNTEQHTSSKKDFVYGATTTTLV